MRTMICVGLLLAAPLAMSAGDKPHPLNVKTGLWEVTTLGGLKGAPPKPPGMTAEQHARWVAAWKRNSAHGSRPVVRKECVTKEQLNAAPFSGDMQACNPTIVDSTSTRLSVRFDCEVAGMKRTGTAQFVARDPEHVAGTVNMDFTGRGSTMKVNSDFTAKWVSPSCSAK